MQHGLRLSVFALTVPHSSSATEYSIVADGALHHSRPRGFRRAIGIFLQQILNGLTLGGTYSLVALGLTLVYGILHVPQFAHGAFYMAGAFASWHLMNA